MKKNDVVPVSIQRKAFNDAYFSHLTNYARIQILYGGSSSGKSVFLAQRTVWDILKGGRNYLVCRAVAKTIKKSTFEEIKKVIAAWGMLAEFKINETDFTITCRNGYQIIFAGLDDIEKLKSITPAVGVITDVWVEEATETEKNDIKQLLKRQRGGSAQTPKRLTMSFNPILQSHWIYEEYFSGIAWADDQTEYNGEKLTILKTTYKDNRFLPPDDIDDLESETDKYYYEVYTRGNWGVLGNVIFTNWEVRDLSEMVDQFTNRRNGLDFGFSSDPAAISRSHYDRNHKTIYIFDELYELGLTNDVLAVDIKEMIGQDYITCDSAEPKSIAELQRHGVNALAAKKGKDSVIFGIQWLQQQRIVIDKKCVKAKNEFMQAKWKEDKDGNAIRQPVDKNNHYIDATRYAYEQDSMASVVTVVANPFY
jgi:phage terminase large subunit